MSAAQAFQTAELLGPPLEIPYQAAGFEALARELIAITRRADHGGSRPGDR
jgi:hypothetical protein